MVFIKNTFGLKATTHKIVCATTIKSTQKKPWLILGACSNVVLPEEVQFNCVSILKKEITVIADNNDHIIIRVDGGHNWNELVEICLLKKWHGLENLISIPGTVGAAPVQNIGAYGVEISQRIETVHTINLSTLKKHKFSNNECEFAYRDSVFKSKLVDHIIIAVDLKLDKEFNAITSHRDLIGHEQKNHIEISEIIRNTRLRKLPDIKLYGNAGSFFKNPIVENNACIKELTKYPTIDPRFVKLSAAELIEKSGLKGKSIRGASVSKQHALIIVNTGFATYKDIVELSKEIQNSVYEKYNIKLEPEVKIISQDNLQLAQV